MPAKKMYRRKKKPARRAAKVGYVKRKFKPVSTAMTGNLNTSIFPNRKLFKFRYSEFINLDPDVSGSMTSVRFGSNNLYDPYTAAGGHQPYGFDQVSPFYNKFTVIGAKITVRFLPETSGGLAFEPYTLAVVNNPTGESPVLDWVNLQEKGLRSMRFSILDSTSNPNGVTLMANFSAKRDLSVTNPLDEPNLASSASSSPARVCYFDVYAGAFNRADDMPRIRVNVCIEYVAIATEPKSLTSS